MPWSFVLALIAVLTLPASSLAAGRSVVGYYYFWNRYSFPASSIEYSKLSCISYAFIIPTSAGGISPEQNATWQNYLYPELITTAHQNNVKVIVSVGGYNAAATSAFSALSKTAVARATFAGNMKSFCLANDFDGVDIDWEYPTNNDRANFVSMIRALRDSLNSAGRNLTLSITSGGSVRSGYDINSLYPLLDWVGVMTYDYHGSWTSNSGPVSPLYTGDAEGSVSSSITQFLGSTSIPASKLFMGLPFYGYDFRSKGLYQKLDTAYAPPVTYPQAVAYEKKGWTYHWDNVSMTPYLTDTSNTHVIAFDDTVSIRYKCDYLKSKGLGGVITWEISQDNLGSSQPLLETTWDQLNTPTAVVSRHTEGVPNDFSLSQNYPNPFNPSTAISFRLSSNSRITLKVFDVLGREVRTLVNGNESAGSHSVSFNASGLSSGAYFYVLSIDGKLFTRTMLYLK